MISHRCETIPSALTGEQVDLHLWLPQGEPRGIVQLVHGMAEHICRYDEAARYLAEQGWLVAGHTQLGHGSQASMLGYFGPKAGWETLLCDIHAIRQRLQAEHPHLPYVMLGHSMGSFLARCYLTRHAEGLAGAVLSGTGYYAKGVTLAGLAMANLHIALGLGKRPAPLIHRIAMGKGQDWLTRDTAIVKAYQQDPYCGFIFTACGFRDMFTGLNELSDTTRLAVIPKDLPLYLFSGDQDPIGSLGKGVAKVADQYRRAGLAKVTLRLYPGGRHEMLNELNRDEVMADLARWLEAVVG